MPPKTPVTAQKTLPEFKKPEHVRGVYLTAWSVGSTNKLDHMIDFIGRTEINSFVIDVRDDGNNYWKNEIALSKEVGANTTAVVKPTAVIEKLSKAGVYPIARIACFRDRFVPAKYPDRAVRLAATGGVWKDASKHTWLDPYCKANWDYLGSIVDYALDLGFPEIQLDYVRFPSEGKASTMGFPSKKKYLKKDAKPAEVVAAFAQFIADRVHKRKAIISADVFGVISVNTSDQGIGQELEVVAKPFDLICPMVYPSHFYAGMYNIKNPNAAPFDIVYKSLKDYAKRLPGKTIRPWLQDFSLGVKYGKAEVQAQIKAARSVGYQEYLLWNARNIYTEAAVAKAPVK